MPAACYVPQSCYHTAMPCQPHAGCRIIPSLGIAESFHRSLPNHPIVWHCRIIPSQVVILCKECTVGLRTSVAAQLGSASSAHGLMATAGAKDILGVLSETGDLDSTVGDVDLEQFDVAFPPQKRSRSTGAYQSKVGIGSASWVKSYFCFPGEFRIQRPPAKGSQMGCREQATKGVQGAG